MGVVTNSHDSTLLPCKKALSWSVKVSKPQLPLLLHGPHCLYFLASVGSSFFFLLLLLHFPSVSFSYSPFLMLLEVHLCHCCDQLVTDFFPLPLYLFTCLPFFPLCCLFSPFLTTSSKCYDFRGAGLGFYTHHHTMRMTFKTQCVFLSFISFFLLVISIRTHKCRLNKFFYF